MKHAPGFFLITTGDETAMELAIFAHGGWRKKDGRTTIPPECTLFFYAHHGDYSFMLERVIQDGDRRPPVETATGQMRNYTLSPDRQHDEAFMKAQGREPNLQEKHGQRFIDSVITARGAGKHDSDFIVLDQRSNDHSVMTADIMEWLRGQALGYRIIHWGPCRVDM